MAIPLSLGKQFTKMARGVYQHNSPHFFGDSHRKYFPVEPSAEDQRKALKKSSTYPKIKRCLGAFGYEVVDYMSGTATTSGVKQPMKIGKILQGLEEQTLLDEFKVDSCRAWKELMIVVSRHPYDIVGMSTGREWKSCMTFDSGGDGCKGY